MIQFKELQEKLATKLGNGKDKLILQTEYFKSILELFSHNYSSDLVTRSMVSLTGLGFIDILLAGRGQEIKAKRIEQFVSFLQQEVARIDGDKIDLAYLESDEWMDLLEKALENVTRTKDTNKILAITRILCGVVVENIDNIADPEDLLDVLSELNTEEAILLRVIYEHGEGEYYTITGYGMSLIPHLPEFLHNRIKFLLKRIESIGLISEKTGAFRSYSGGTYSLTTVGKALLGFLVVSEE